MKKLERRDRIIAEAEQKKERSTSPELTVMELDISTRSQKILISAGVKTVGDVLAKLEEGDETLTNLSGFGLKSLATLKKRLRSQGFILPGDEPSEETEETKAAN
jgi:DNA-directed RNA polymerase alpha subunit